MHAEDKPIAEIERELVSVAARHNLTDLQLVHETRHLDGTVSAAEVIAQMRQKLQERSREPVAHAAPIAPRRKMWLPAAGLGLACVLAIGIWIVLR
jgi:hypothetical protein